MLIGVARIVLDFYNNDSLSAKKTNLDQLFKQIRRKYNISFMEIADHDDLERCVIGFAVVIPETWRTSKAREWVNQIARTIDETSFARVIIEDVDLLCHGP